MNGPAGIQQGFTLANRPATGGPGPLSLGLAFSGDLVPSVGASGDGLVFGRPGERPSLAYNGLLAYDSTGQVLPARFEADGATVWIRVDDARATYPVTIDPVFQELAKYTASDGDANDQFGRSMAVEGDTLVIGAQFDDVGANVDQGSAYVFQRGALGWVDATQVAILRSSDGTAGDQFGVDVDISGSTIVVGAERAILSGGGAAYIYEEPLGGWAGVLTETAKLVQAAGGATDRFGRAVAIEDELVAVGAEANDAFFNDPGAVYVFVRPGGGWTGQLTEDATLRHNPRGTGDHLGRTVAIASGTVYSSSHRDPGNTGEVYVFEPPGGVWSGLVAQVAKLTASDAVNGDFLGSSIAADGDVVVAGTPNDDIGALNDQGSVYVWEKPAGGWADGTETVKLTASNPADADQFGASVAVRGAAMVVGAPGVDVGANTSQGAAYVFTRSGALWTSGTELQQLVASDGATDDSLGSSVDLVPEGVWFAGAIGDDLTGVNAGSAYSFSPTFSVSDVTMSEGDGGTTTFTFTISRGDGTGPASVDWSTLDGSAVAPADYTAVPTTTLNFADGETSKTVTVSVVGDTVVEVNDGFTVNLSNAVGASILDGTGVGRITNDDIATFSVTDATVTEGNAGSSTADFTVTRSGATGGSASVTWKTLDAHATAGSDYVGVAPAIITFAPGETSKTLSVTINGDTSVEPNEDFYVRLSAPAGGTIADGSGTGTITNDDTVAVNSFSISDATVTEGDSGTTAANFTVSRSGDTSGAASVTWYTQAGTATAGEDYDPVSTTINFAAGETSQVVTVLVNGDTAVEANEAFNARLTSPVGATIADGTGLGRITNDDAATLSIGDATVTEGDDGTVLADFTITRSGDTGGSASVTWATAAGTATAGTDYVPVASTVVSFVGGETAKIVSVTVIGDTIFEGNETFLVKISAPVNAGLVDPSGLGRITNDD